MTRRDQQRRVGDATQEIEISRFSSIMSILKGLIHVLTGFHPLLNCCSLVLRLKETICSPCTKQHIFV